MSPIFALELAASVATIVQIYLYGRMTWWGPAIGILSASLFCVYMVVADAWGFLPLNAVALSMHILNLWKWRRSL